MSHRYAAGSSSADYVERSNLRARKFTGAGTPLCEPLQDAGGWNQQTAADCRATPLDDIIYETAEKERLRPPTGPFMTKTSRDRKYGVGGWRAIRRRTAWQSSHGKRKCIDNARRPGHTQQGGFAF